MADSYVGATDQPEGAGVKLLRMFQHLVGAKSVQSEGVVVVDPTDPAAAQAVKSSAPAASDYGAVVRPVGLVGNLPAASVWQAVPAVAADLIAGTATMVGLHFVNTTAGVLTVTLKDKAGVPLTILSFDIPAKSVLDLNWRGAVFNSGLNWVASGVGLVGSVVAYQ